MKRTFFFFNLILLNLSLPAQIGLKAGVNFANVTNAASLNNSSRTGFHTGLFLSPPSTGILGYRTEVIFSRQGYNFQTGSKTGEVSLDYILLPQLVSINLTKYVSLQFGAQMAFLLNAKVDSSGGSGSSSSGNVMDLYNRFDYGYAGGVELHPVKGLLVGARMNISLGKLYKEAQSGMMPSFSSVDLKSNVFQLFAGWRFGKTPASKQPAMGGM